MNCSLWRPGVLITEHTKAYHKELADSTFCLAFPGDGWSSRVLDGVIHGCVPVIFQDESYMFLQGAFAAVGAGIDYANFSITLPEAELPRLLEHLDAVTPAQLAAYQRTLLWVRDYFVYKDLYSPYRFVRRELLGRGRANQDAFMLLALALEARARSLPPRRGIHLSHDEWVARNRRLLKAADL